MEKLQHLLAQAGLIDALQQVEKLSTLLESCLGFCIQDRAWPLIRKRRLVILTDDPHLATQARFSQKVLLKHFNEQLKLQLVGVDIKLVSLGFPKVGKPLSRLPIQAETAQTLMSVAEDINDEELRQSLHNLAETALQRTKLNQRND